MLIILLVGVSSLMCFSQKVEKEVVLYESPGKDTKLINAYGVINLNIVGGNIQDNAGPILNEVIDLGENGFLIRHEISILHFSNDLKKIAEFDLVNLFDKSNGAFQYFQYQGGVLICQKDYSGNITSKKIGNYDFKKGFSVKNVQFNTKVDISTITNYEKDNILNISAYNSKTKEIEKYFFSIPDLKNVNSYKEQKEQFGPNAENYGAVSDSIYWVMEKADKNQFKVLLFKRKKQDGTFEDLFKSSLDFSKVLNSKSEHTIVKLTIGSYKTEYPLLTYERLYHHDKAKQIIYFIYNLRADKAIFTIAFNYKENKVFSNYFSVSEQEKEVSEKLADIDHFSILKRMDLDDAGHYELQDGLLVNLHSSTEAGGLRNIREGYYIFLNKNGQISRIDKMYYTTNNVRHKGFNLLPEKEETLYKDKIQKPNEWDFISTFNEKGSQKDNMFHILRKDGFSYIIQIEKQNSKITCYKVSFN